MLSLYGGIPTVSTDPRLETFEVMDGRGFLEPNKHKTLEVVAKECLADLDDRSRIFVHESSFTNQIKTCSIHSAIWPFYERVAAEHKVFHAVESYKQGADPTHRRFSIYKNVLFAIKDVYDSLACVSNTRSLLCTGPYHPYSLRVILSFRLLRVFDALSIRFYKFPDEILKLVLLRFLAFTLNKGELPASLSNLGELQFLIVRRHSNIKSCGAMSFLPIEIWYMKELRHLQVMRGDVPSPSDYMNALLPSLSTLSDVDATSCTREILERTPNLMKLGVRVELDWGAEAAVVPLQHLFDRLTTLSRLKTFKCVVKNPFKGTHCNSASFIFPTETQEVDSERMRISLGKHESNCLIAQPESAQTAVSCLSRPQMGTGKE